MDRQTGEDRHRQVRRDRWGTNVERETGETDPLNKKLCAINASILGCQSLNPCLSVSFTQQFLKAPHEDGEREREGENKEKRERGGEIERPSGECAVF